MMAWMRRLLAPARQCAEVCVVSEKWDKWSVGCRLVLRFLVVSLNQLSGSIPDGVGNLMSLRYVCCDDMVLNVIEAGQAVRSGV